MIHMHQRLKLQMWPQDLLRTRILYFQDVLLLQYLLFHSQLKYNQFSSHKLIAPLFSSICYLTCLTIERYDNFQGLLAMARLTGGSNGANVKGSCKRCGGGTLPLLFPLLSYFSPLPLLFRFFLTSSSPPYLFFSSSFSSHLFLISS